MKTLLFIGIVLSNFCANSQIDFEIKKGMIYWSNMKLTWEDFKGKPSNSNYHAETMSAIDMQMAFNGDSLVVYVASFFSPKQSWKKKKNLTEHLLAHEQLHFDITEYQARLLRKDISLAKIKKPELAGKTLEDLFNKRIKYWKKMQNEYDQETNHSKNLEAQANWEKKVKDLLKEEDAFEKTIVRIKILSIN